MNHLIKPTTVKLLSQILKPWVEQGVISHPESQEIIAQLRHLSQKGEPIPVVVPKLLHQKEVAEMLGVGLSNFKKLEAEGAFPFERRMLRSSVRYRNTDVVKFILADDSSRT